MLNTGPRSIRQFADGRQSSTEQEAHSPPKIPPNTAGLAGR